MPEIVYKPNVGRGSALEGIGRGPDMRRFMQSVAEGAAGVARRKARNPRTISTSTQMGTPRGGRGSQRWVSTVTNTHRGARFEEYGGRGWQPPGRPLGHALDTVAAADPNRRRGRRITGP